MRKMLNIRCYSYQLKCNVICMNCVRVLIAIDNAKCDASVDRVRRSSVNGGILSKHSSELFSQIYL